MDVGVRGPWLSVVRDPGQTPVKRESNRSNGGQVDPRSRSMRDRANRLGLSPVNQEVTVLQRRGTLHIDTSDMIDSCREVVHMLLSY